MVKRDYKLYLNDIIEAINKINTFVDGLDFIAFAEDIKTVDAVMKNFIVIGEAINNLPPEIKTNHPEISWHHINGMRNKMIHEYAEIDFSKVYKFLKKAPEEFKLFDKAFSKYIRK